MTVNQIKVGQCYVVQLCKRELPVRIESANTSGGWNGRALTHGRMIQIKDDSQVIYLLNTDEIREIALGKIPPRRSAERGIIFRNENKSDIADNVSTSVSTERTCCVYNHQTIIIPRMNILEAARRVLRESKVAMTTREIVLAAFEKRYWFSRAATPWATLHAALSRDIKLNGKNSYFVKCGRGKFSLR
ncbi:MAG: winged helix-turn-helix domain-containing protein [Planctomycetaceae bacterium]|jgi:hypothetical protein|nr:winged helix-turn-helix domain-containing protein [Planctomycetaceae bacterium]